jgi:hypothetical protein
MCSGGWMTSVLTRAPVIVMITPLILQIYTDRRTRHYMVAKFADVAFWLFVFYMISGIWGSAALLHAFWRAMDATAALDRPKAHLH